MLDSIIQWNIQPLRSNFSELKIVLNRYHPACVCLQEILSNNRRIPPPSGYRILLSPVTREDNHERGAAILIKNNIFYQEITINTNLQAIAAKIYINNRTYSICSVYLPHLQITKQEISSLITQLQPPFLILGDMNARSPVWGDHGVSSPNARGLIFEQLLLEHRISLLNDESNTHYHVQTNSYSTIDLSIRT